MYNWYKCIFWDNLITMYSRFAIYELMMLEFRSAFTLNLLYKEEEEICNLPLRGFLLTILIHFVDEFFELCHCRILTQGLHHWRQLTTGNVPGAIFVEQAERLPKLWKKKEIKSYFIYSKIFSKYSNKSINRILKTKQTIHRAYIFNAHEVKND